MHKHSKMRHFCGEFDYVAAPVKNLKNHRENKYLAIQFPFDEFVYVASTVVNFIRHILETKHIVR